MLIQRHTSTAGLAKNALQQEAGFLDSPIPDFRPHPPVGSIDRLCFVAAFVQISGRHIFQMASPLMPDYRRGTPGLGLQKRVVLFQASRGQCASRPTAARSACPIRSGPCRFHGLQARGSGSRNSIQPGFQWSQAGRWWLLTGHDSQRPSLLCCGGISEAGCWTSVSHGVDGDVNNARGRRERQGNRHRSRAIKPDDPGNRLVPARRAAYRGCDRLTPPSPTLGHWPDRRTRRA